MTNKINKENELVKNKTNLTNQTNTLKEKIKEVLYDKNTPSRVKKETISNTLILSLEQSWYFVNSNVNLYYFYEENNTLYDISKSEFEYLIHSIWWINPTDIVYSFLIKEIEFHTIKCGNKVEIKEFSYYDKDKNILYIFNNGNKIIKITEKNIDIINNWNDNIIFLKKEHYQEWNYNKINNTTNYIQELLESINFDQSIIVKEEYIIILKNYIYSLFFPELLSNRPILVFVWEKGSWKSYTFEILQKIFYGENVSLWTLQSKEDDIKSNLINEFWCIFDNVDWKVDDWKIDLLCSVSTWTSIKVRKLYKNNEIIITKINCFVWITTRNPYFKRDDLCDRMIIVHFDRRNEWFESSNLSQEKFIQNRDYIMSWLCRELQSKLKEIKKINNYKTNFRVSDFSNFVINLNKDKEAELVMIFDKIVTTQQELTNSTDSLVILIDYIIEDSKTNIMYWFKEWEFYKASDLHRIFSDYAKDNRHLVNYWFKSVKSLSKALNINQISYKNINNINIETRKIWWNLVSYSISKLINQNDIKEIF